MNAIAARLPHWTASALLALPLAISPLLGLLTPYAVALIAIVLWLVTAFRGQLVAAYASYPARALLLVFLLLAVLFSLTAEAPADALNAFNFIMLLLFGPIALLLRRYAAPENGRRVANLALLGVAFGFASILWRVVEAPGVRPTGLNIGPIVLSNALLALGFIALGGVLLTRSWRAWAYVAAPVLAIAATILTGSRGPMLAIPFLVLFGLVYLGATRFRGSRAFLIGGLVLLAAGAAGAFLLLGTRSASILAIVSQLASGAEISDTTTRIRLTLYDAGWQAFLQQPWFGHGWADIMNAIKPLLAAEDRIHAELPQLHNDVLDFAVAGGVFGVIAYLVIITTPVIGALRSPRDSQRAFRIYGASVLTITYVCGGVTDLMFGFEFHTALFVMLAVILLFYCRDTAVPGMRPKEVRQ